MPDIAGLQSVVSAPVEREGISAGIPEELAERVGRLKIDTRGWPQRRLKLKRVVVRVSEIRIQGRAAELGTGLDEILREIIVAQHGALDSGGNDRQAGIARE